jgi:hypothetical protein
MRLTHCLVALAAAAASASAQGHARSRPFRLDLQTQGAVARQPQPQPGVCWTTPEVYWFTVEGRVDPLQPGQHLVLLVNPMLWDGRRIGWFTQCQAPRLDGRGRYTAIGQVGSEGVPGGGWFAGQRATVAMVVTTQRPAPGTMFADPAQVPGALAISPARTIHLVAPNSFQVTTDCDATQVSMAPLAVPALGNGAFGMDVGSRHEGETALLLVGLPTYIATPLVGGRCALHLGDDPLLGAAGAIRGAHWQVSIPVPNSPSLRGHMFALQSVVYAAPAAIAWSSAAWLVTPW